jgi:hypothetical protein
LSGTGLELKPIDIDDLYSAIETRVARFHNAPNGKAPLPQIIHKHLYEASHGEIRFVFKYCGSICSKFIAMMRIGLAKYKDQWGGAEVLDIVIGKNMVDNQISEVLANSYLVEIVKTELNGFNLKTKEKELLKSIGAKGSVRAKDFKELGFSSMQELSSNYLSKLYTQHLLNRKQEGRAVLYSLRGISSLASEFGLLD